MSTTAPNPTAGYHAFTAAVAARDIDALADALAPDAVLHSPITNTPFEGREVITDLYLSLFASFEDVRIEDEFEAGDTLAFFWEAKVDGRYVAGADRLRTDANGKVRDITVIARPLTGLAGFLTGAGYHFARRRRGRVVARIMRVTSLPLPPMFSLVDRIVSWLIRGKGSSR
jgi:ketosteroid isomerase-like protein